MRAVHHVSRLVMATVLSMAVSTAFAADDEAWMVSKSSGEVWLTSTSAQPASLKQEELLKAGDTIRTGRNGRVLLKRGEESMMISPNSVIGVPAEKKEGLSTTIVQQAGSVLLEVEKRNVKHFEVETPYLAAVVKGTQFRVTVNASGTSVDVIRGQVEVADFRTGQIAQVKPGQHATTFSRGNGGLSLSGSGTFSPIEQGKPRTPSVERVQTPRAGLAPPRSTMVGQAFQSTNHGVHTRSDQGANPHSGAATAKPGVTRISSSIGEVRLNFHSVTHGLARDHSSSHDSKNASNKATIWESGSGGTTSVTTGAQNNSSAAATSAGTAGVTSTSAAASVAAAGSATSDGGSGNSNGNGNANGNGKGNNGNGNGGNANGNGGNGNGHGHGHGNGNGNGNNGNGNGHGNGNGNH